MTLTHPLKVLRYCPKCGSDNFKTTGIRCLRCSECGFILFVNSSAAVAALISNEEGRLLLTVRGIEPGYGKLDLPGGFVNPLESAENAVERELFEELGLKVRSLEYIESAPNEYVFNGLSVFTLDMAFRVVPETLDDLEPMDDIMGFMFYAEDEIDFNRIQAPSINYFVKRYFKNE